MSEGGMFPWKIQKIFNVPVGRYERLRESLPKPPHGMAWFQNKETREWKLVPVDELATLEPSTTTTTSRAAAAVAQADVPPADNESEEIVDFEVNPNDITTPTKEVFANPFNLPETNNVNNDTITCPDSFTHHSNNNHFNNLHKNDDHFNNNNQVVLNNLPGSNEDSKSDEADDWELLSDRASSLANQSSSHTNSSGKNGGMGMAFVTRSGSVSSHSHHSSGYNNNKQHLPLPPHQLHRQLSNSTIDSHDVTCTTSLGPSGKGVLGVDYVEHVILPSDTLQGICLAYKITASRLKRANHFSGETLLLAPKKLVIPISTQAIRQGYLRVQDTDSKEYKMHAIQAEVPALGLTEAKAYLELADWVLPDAVQSAREDFEWESNLLVKDAQGRPVLRAGEIRVMMNVQERPDGDNACIPVINFAAQGAGYHSPPRSGKREEEKTASPEPNRMKPVDPRSVHAKSVKMADIHAATSQHNSIGVEMQSFSTNHA